MVGWRVGGGFSGKAGWGFFRERGGFFESFSELARRSGTRVGNGGKDKNVDVRGEESE